MLANTWMNKISLDTIVRVYENKFIYEKRFAITAHGKCCTVFSERESLTLRGLSKIFRIGYNSRGLPRF